MDKNGILCPSKNVTLASEHVSYLENGLVLMAQIFTHIFLLQIRSVWIANGFQFSGQRKLLRKKVFSIYYYSTGTLYREICLNLIGSTGVVRFYCER